MGAAGPAWGGAPSGGLAPGEAQLCRSTGHLGHECAGFAASVGSSELSSFDHCHRILLITSPKYNPTFLRIPSWVLGILAGSFWKISLLEVFALSFFLINPAFFFAGQSKFTRNIFLLGLSYSVIQLLTDIFRGTNFASSLQGVFIPLIISISINFLVACLRGRPVSHLYIFFVAFTFASTFSNILGLGALFFTWFVRNPWKWGLLTTLLPIIALQISRTSATRNVLNYFIISFVSLFLFAILSYLNDSRSGALYLVSFILSSVYFATNSSLSSIFYKKNNKTISLVLSFILILLILPPVNTFVTNTLSNSNESDDFQRILSQQNKDNSMMENLLRARPELVSSYFAIKDNPLIGQGSYALDTKNYELEKLYFFSDTLDSFERQRLLHEKFNDDYFNIHSHLFTSWIWAGIIGAIFWIYILIGIISRVASMTYSKDFFLPSIISIPLIWSILFSPLGFSNRISSSIGISLIILFAMINSIDQVSTIPRLRSSS